MTFALLALICLVALAGPALALPGWLHLPVVIGELLVGVLLGATGLNVVHADDPTLHFLAEVGFVLVMFVAGTHVPLRDPALRRGAGRGALRAGLVAVVALAAGLGVAALFGTGHGLLYAVLLASSSAGVVLPALAGADLSRPPLADMVPQIAVADTACIVLLPLAVDPSRAGRAALGALVVVAAAVLAWWVLADPTTSPYGTPIPGLDRIGYASTAPRDVEVIRLSELGTRAPTRVRLRALGENVQVDPELLTRLQRAGLAPHQELTVSRDGDDVVLEGASGDSVTVDLDHAHAIQVELLP